MSLQQLQTLEGSGGDDTSIGAGRPTPDRPPSPFGGGPDEMGDKAPQNITVTTVPQDSPFADEADEAPSGQLPSSTDAGQLDTDGGIFGLLTGGLLAVVVVLLAFALGGGD